MCLLCLWLYLCLRTPFSNFASPSCSPSPARHDPRTFIRKPPPRTRSHTPPLIPCLITQDGLFSINASIVQNLAEGVAKYCPSAAFLISALQSHLSSRLFSLVVSHLLCLAVSNPVNSTVPIAAETLKKAGVYDPKKLFGVTTLDVCRSNRFLAEHFGTDPADNNVTVVGGHAGTTILPLLSRHPQYAEISEEDVAALTHRIQFGGDEVVQAKEGAGSATLSMAWAGAHMAEQVMRAFDGESGIVECSYVDSDVTDAAFFSTPVELGVSAPLIVPFSLSL